METMGAEVATLGAETVAVHLNLLAAMALIRAAMVQQKGITLNKCCSRPPL